MPACRSAPNNPSRPAQIEEINHPHHRNDRKFREFAGLGSPWKTLGSIFPCLGPASFRAGRCFFCSLHALRRSWNSFCLVGGCFVPAHGRDAHASEIVSTVDDVASPHVAAEAENLHADIASELVTGLWAHGSR